MAERTRKAPLEDKPCQVCGESFTPKTIRSRFCSKQCQKRNSNVQYRANMKRICERTDCERKVFSRNLCPTHYNQTYYPERHRKREVACVVCGTKVMRRVDNSRLDSHCCSVECRTFRQTGKAGATLGIYTWNADAKKRARNFGCQVIEDVDREAVLERDNWRCYLCGKDTSLTDDPFSSDSATVDHVIPLSRGGEHSMRNVRCACLACNAGKADREVASRLPAA